MNEASRIKIETESNTINRITISNKKLILVGTAHISSQSVEEVARVIKSESPDHVCIEIDEGRYNSVIKGNAYKDMDLSKVFKEGKGFLILANLVLGSSQQKLGADLGTRSGDEMRAAIDAASAQNVPISFSDRPIQVTLQRAWAKCNLWKKLKLLSVLLASAFSNTKISEEELEKMKHGSAIDNMMDELASFLPPVKEVLIDERDRYLATKIFEAPGQKIVAVVGAGHVPGLIGWLKKLATQEASTSLEDISVIPSKSFGTKMLPWIVPAVIAALFVAGIFLKGIDVFMDMGMAWILGNGIFAATGAIIALAKPQTVVASFIAAPITSLNPTIGVGFVTGILEYYFRKPRVVDLENLTSDAGSLKGWYKNRVTRIMLVFFLSSVGSSIGTFWAFTQISVLMAQ